MRMKENWEIKKLGECFKLKSGTPLISGNMAEGTIPVFGGEWHNWIS